MSKVTDFYAKAIADEAAKKELTDILGSKSINEASDEQLVKIGELAKKLGFDITLEEAKSYLTSEETELGEDDLDAVAGGFNGKGVGRDVCSGDSSGISYK